MRVTARSYEKRSLWLAMQHSLGLRAIALDQPRCFIIMNRGCRLSQCLNTAALKQHIQTALSLAMFQQPPATQ